MTRPRPIHQLLPDLTLACGHDGTERAVLNPAKVTCRDGACGTAAHAARARAARTAARAGRIEDYLEIGGDRMSAAQAAARLGVCARTVVRYRAQLRTGRPALP